jgi:hypothetical protein
MWLADMTVKEIAHAIHSEEHGMGLTDARVIRFIDPAMDKENDLIGGFNTRTELMKYGIACSRANNDFDYGISKIREALRPTFFPLLNASIPRLRISQRCRHLIYEFQHYIWDDYTMRPEEHDTRYPHEQSYGGKQKVKKKNDHFIDCLRYILNANPRYFQSESDVDDVVYEGEYTKHPTSKTRGSGSSRYYDLVEK